MYRFSSDDNDRAAHFFRMSLRQDPTFARAHAGLSFTHFQNAFLLRPAQRQKEIERAYETAGNSLIADDRDPAAHWAMGRALWLRGNQDEALRELDEALTLSPNFALGHYTLGFVHGQSGDPRVAIASADYSRQLSPFDPLMFGMLCSRALGHLRLGQYQDAADWASQRRCASQCSRPHPGHRCELSRRGGSNRRGSRCRDLIANERASVSDRRFAGGLQVWPRWHCVVSPECRNDWLGVVAGRGGARCSWNRSSTHP